MGRGLAEECDSWDTVTGIITGAAAVGTRASTTEICHVQRSAGRSVNDRGAAEGSPLILVTKRCRVPVDRAVPAQL